MSKARTLSTTPNSTFGFKNRIINGAMTIDQRNAGAAQAISSGTAVYTLDRWLVYAANAGLTSQRVGSLGAYSLQITGSASNNGSQILQRIESYNIADLAGQTATFSFTMSSSTLSSLSVYYATPNTQDNYSGTSTPVLLGSPSLTSTPTKFTYTFTIPSTATNGLEVFFQIGSFASGTLTIANVQLEAGSSATGFDFRPYGQELVLCQRYYQQGFTWFGKFNSATSFYGYGTYQVEMRAAPTATYIAGGSISELAVSDRAVTAIPSYSGNNKGGYFQATVSGATSGAAGANAAGAPTVAGFSAEI
jgi:hypothetical protein